MLVLLRIYMPVLNWAVANRGIMLGAAVGLVLMTVALSRLLGLEFLRSWKRATSGSARTLPPTISLQEGNSYVNEMRKVIRARPEVESVVSQHGRPTTAPMPPVSSTPSSLRR